MANVAIIKALKVLGKAVANELTTLITSDVVPELFSTLSDLDASMNNISSELRVMQAFIDQTELIDQSNKVKSVWIEEVQKIANRIKDTADEFVYLIDNKKFEGTSFYWKRIFKDRKSWINLKRIASQLQAIEKNLEHLAKIKERWVPATSTGLDMNLCRSNECAQHIAIAAHFIEGDIVGKKENRGVLSSWINSGTPQLSVISVWGMGGVGKTTLVTNVFKGERKNFDCHAWISISQSYTIENILRNIISEITRKDEQNIPIIPIDTTTMDLRGLKEYLRNVLKIMKYLIVLDDMWDPKAFLDIRDTLVDNHRCSRIVLTSRMAEVANLAPESNRLELQPLTKEESWDLFCRKAFHLEKNNECPPPLDRWAREIVLKCDGLPLALVSVGGVLSLLDQTESEWKRVYDQLRWELNNNPHLSSLKSILSLSFHYLPSYLKSCFLYCGLFPEDSQLKRKQLIRLWIAEGFIEQKGKSTLEEVAEGYLKELIYHSMLQVVQKNSSGRAKRCRMHDTLRELAISLCKSQNFGLLHEDNMTINFNTSIRRLSIVKIRGDINHDIYLPQLITFMSVESLVPSFVILGKSRCLTVLSLEGMPIKTIPDEIGDFFNLRYLGLRHTKVKFLPKSIQNLKNLQTLDLMDSKIQNLPDGIALLSKLRHLFAQVWVDRTYRMFQSKAGVSLPKSMFYLKELQTLQALESNDTILRELGNLTQLRSFRILNVKENHSKDLCRSLSMMSSLSYLSIFASNENFILQLEGLKFLPQLQKLCFFGRLKEDMLDSPFFQNSGETIEMLRLGWCQLQKDPLPSLSNLKNLTWLTLQKAYEGRKLNFQAEWFPKLKHLSLRQMNNLVQVNMEQGTLMSLEKINLFELEKLVEIPMGIENLTNLKWMICTYMPLGFGDMPSGIHQLFHFRCHVI